MAGTALSTPLPSLRLLHQLSEIQQSIIFLGAPRTLAHCERDLVDQSYVKGQ